MAPFKKPELQTKQVTIGKKEALYFLAHIVGDIHQPLHAGNDKDRGGNDCVVKWFGKVRKGEGFWNLHSLWDSGLFILSGVGRRGLTNDVMSRLSVVKRRDILAKKKPLEWVLESAALRPAVYPQIDKKNPVDEFHQPYCNNPKYEKLPGKYAGQGEDAHVIEVDKLHQVSTQLLKDPQVPRLGYDIVCPSGNRKKAAGSCWCSLGLSFGSGFSKIANRDRAPSRKW